VKRLVILPFLLLTACAGKPDIQIVDSSCSWVKPIFISKADKLTDKTAGEILAHDEKWKQFCGNK